MPMQPMEVPSNAAAQHQALQVLTLAQRTAEEHLVSAKREADRICSEARDTASQIVRDAQAHGESLQRDAEQARAESHAAAAQVAKDARRYADEARQDAEEVLSDARMRADEIAKHAQAEADELKHLAQQRYEDVVGSLAARREALQQQIEALERFDREYRSRLQAFMQGQLRALWVDQPQPGPDLPEQSEPMPGVGPLPADTALPVATPMPAATMPAPRDERDQLADS